MSLIIRRLKCVSLHLHPMQFICLAAVFGSQEELQVKIRLDGTVSSRSLVSLLYRRPIEDRIPRKTFISKAPGVCSVYYLLLTTVCTGASSCGSGHDSCMTVWTRTETKRPSTRLGNKTFAFCLVDVPMISFTTRTNGTLRLPCVTIRFGRNG